MIVTTTPGIEGKPIVGVTLDIEALGQSGSMLMISVTGTAVVVQ